MRDPEITFTWTAAEAEEIARWLENIDVSKTDAVLIDLKERFYKATGRDFLLDASGKYTV